MIEKMIKKADEVNVLASYYLQDQNTEEIRNLAMERGIPKEDTEAFLAGKRYRLVQIPISQKEFLTSAEKLSEEMLALKDPGMATVIGTYLLNRAKEEDLLDQKILLPYKSLQRCMDYIQKKAYQAALEQEKEKRQENMGIGIPEETVFAWAKEYFQIDDSREVQEKEKKEIEKNQKSWRTANTVRALAGASKSGKTLNKKNDRKKAALKETAESESNLAKKSAEPEQFSLFSL